MSTQEQKKKFVVFLIIVNAFPYKVGRDENDKGRGIEGDVVVHKGGGMKTSN